MTEEDKELLLKDLCARLSYGVKVLQNNGIESILDGCPSKKEYCFNLIWYSHKGFWNLCQAVITKFKPYLRSMSSMAEEEQKEFGQNCGLWKREGDGGIHFINRLPNLPNEFADILISEIIMTKAIDWLNAHHFDYRGLIEKGLALEAPEGMYKVKKK